MPRLPVICTMLLLTSSVPTSTHAQSLDEWSFDPAALVAGSNELVLRAPDPAIDQLFQALHASAQNPDEATAMCALFDPGADRSLQGLNTVASQLGDASRERFAGALAEALIAAAQQPRQPYDPAMAKQGLKASGVTAAILHDGFVAGLNGGGNDVDSRDARCRSLGWLLEAMQSRPLVERAPMTRYLLTEGLAKFVVQ